MTPEQLLKKRFKAIAPYPFSYYEVDSILLFEFYHAKDGIVYFAEYPHLFRELQWYEERAEGDMPEYLKCIKTPDQIHFKNECFKVKWYEKPLHTTIAKSERGAIVISTNCYVPITEQEYNTYNQSNQK